MAAVWSSTSHPTLRSKRTRAGGGASLASYVREKRASRGWTQTQLASSARISVDSIRRIEGGTYRLPIRPRDDGHVLDKVGAALGVAVCEVVTACFSETEIAASY